MLSHVLQKIYIFGEKKFTDSKTETETDFLLEIISCKFFKTYMLLALKFSVHCPPHRNTGCPTIRP